MADRRFRSGAHLAAWASIRLQWAGFLCNGVGASIITAFTLFLAPNTVDSDQLHAVLVRNIVAFLLFMPVAMLGGRQWVNIRPFEPLRRWLRSERPAGDMERLLALQYPKKWALKSAAIWTFAAILFSMLNVDQGAGVAAGVGVTVLLGAVTACALQYLVVERILRPVTARALAGGPPPRVASPGVAARLTMAWTLATGVPLLGVVAMVLQALLGANLSRGQVLGATLFLGLLALGVGLASMVLAARSVGDPVVAVRRAQEQLEFGDFRARVPVHDGSEVGLLQAGFNRMAQGLDERERLREAFGTFVDPGLTERVLEEGTDLTGEEVEATVMFVDVRDFTSFAERAHPRDVVARLNDLYGLVVPILLRHRGHASKFIGDGLLAVFGAPERLEDHAARAVDAALEIAETVRERYGDELRVGIGLNSGRVVVGTVGGGGRLDFTVIGDAVNTAARVEAATRDTGDEVLITDATLALLDGHPADWKERPAVPLKGKSRATALYAPRETAASEVAGA